MRLLFLDLETRSCADLRKVGLYRYAQDLTTDCILAAYAIGTAEPQLWYHHQPLPAELEEALRDPDVRLVAHNAAFERLLIREVLGPVYGWPVPPLERWHCTMAMCRAAGLPGALEGALAALGHREGKDMEGHQLMLRMCRPRRWDEHGKPVWWEDPQRMERLALYCGRDVKGSQRLYRALHPLTPEERQIWLATEVINDTGVRFDSLFCRVAMVVAGKAREALDREMREVTGHRVTAASNVGGLKAWIPSRGVPLVEVDDEELEEEEEKEPGTKAPDPGLRRRDIQQLLLRPGLPADVRRALEIRLAAGKTSTRKLDSILQRAEEDGRVRGLLGYHGAITGRFAATGGVQIQNFPRDVVQDWEEELGLMVEGEAELGDDKTLDLISRMLRGAIIPAEEHQILAADYSSVEAVGVAWLADCAPLLQAFRTKAPVYEMMGARVFGVPWQSVEKDSLVRFLGKTIILGSGYGMGWSKFQHTCLQQGRAVDDELAQRSIGTYRDTYPEIPQLWRALEKAAIKAVREPNTVQWANRHVAFRQDTHYLRMRLPSGRVIRYRQPRITKDDRFGTDKLVFMGVDPKTKRWGEQSTYGGRLCENAVQGLCRDLMVAGMLRLLEAGYRVITLVHDEIVCEVPIGSNSQTKERAVELMCELPAWAAGFPLRAEAKLGDRYVK